MPVKKKAEEFLTILQMAKRTGIPKSTLYTRARKHPDYKSWPRRDNQGASRAIPLDVENWLVDPELWPHTLQSACR